MANIFNSAGGAVYTASPDLILSWIADDEGAHVLVSVPGGNIWHTRLHTEHASMHLITGAITVEKVEISTLLSIDEQVIDWLLQELNDLQNPDG